MIFLVLAACLPSQITVSHFVSLRSETEGTAYVWHIIGPTGAVEPASNDGGRTAVFGGQPGKYHILLVVASKDGKLSKQTQVVEIGDGTVPPGPSPVPPVPPPPGPQPGPNPPPPPGPDPQPEPVPPDTETGLAKFVFTQCKQLSAEARAKAKPLAEEFRALASAIKAGALNVLQIPARTREAFDRAVAEQKDAWMVVDAAVQTELRRLNREGLVTNKEQLADAYEDIAAGLEVVK